MLEKKIREQIIALINKEVVPAVGCTEPMAVALCTAKAAEVLGCRPTRITAVLSSNILKNAMGVGIPGTGMIGLPIAIALGATIGKSEYELEVIKDLTPDTLEEAKKLIGADGNEPLMPILIKSVQTKPDCQCWENDKLYIEVICEADGHKAVAKIACSHTNFIYVEIDGKEVPHQTSNGEPLPLGSKRRLPEQETSPKGRLLNSDDILLASPSGDGGLQLGLRLVYDFATTTPVDEIRFILKTREYNFRAAEESIKGNYGHCLGKTIDRPLAHGIFGNSIFSHIISKTASACDARMGGAMIPVMSNSGSGNQGICATNPVAVYALENENTEEETIRALTLSHLTAIYIKQSLGKLSALCGCVVASIGSSCGITYLMGGDYERVCYSVKNMIANLTGMICDGAKPSCSLKITSGVSTALLSALLSMENRHVTSAEGIIDDDVDKSIHNLTSIGKDAMTETDSMVLDIMTSKSKC